MRVLITGATGQLGLALQSALVRENVTALGHADLDVTDQRAVSATVADARPEFVVHTAAWTDTAGCERDPARATLVNGAAAGYVAEACARSGAKLLHISTNEVFDGETDEPYDEDSQPRPVNAYGRSKLEGEHLVGTTLDHCAIVRTSWLYGPGRKSFPEKVLDIARRDGKLRLVTDEVANPTFTVDLAQAIAALLRSNPSGVYHLTNDGYCSRFEWAHAILDLAGLADCEVEPVTQAEFGSPVQKPHFSALANTRAKALGINLRSWRDALAEHMAGARVGSSNR